MECPEGYLSGILFALVGHMGNSFISKQWISLLAVYTNCNTNLPIGTVSTGGTANETIMSIPNGTTLAAFKAAITPKVNTTFKVYDADGTTTATTLVTGKKVIVTAQDGITKVTYSVTVNNAPSNDNEDDDSSITPTNDTVTSKNGKLNVTCREFR